MEHTKIDLGELFFSVHNKGQQGEEEPFTYGDFEIVFSWINTYPDLSNLEVGAMTGDYSFDPMDAKKWLEWAHNIVLPKLPENGWSPEQELFIIYPIAGVFLGDDDDDDEISHPNNRGWNV